jgi:Type IV secretion system pilin
MKRSVLVMKFLTLLFFIFLIVSPQIVKSAPLTAADLGISYGADTGLGSTDVRTTVARIIRVALGLLGIVAVAGIVVGGFMYMTAGGNEEKAGQGTKAITAALIGLIIILSAYAIASFVISNLVAATTQ